MANQINNLQFTKQKWHSGLTEQNNLATALLTEPEILSKTLAYAFGPKKYALQYLTQGMGRMSKSHKLIGNREFRWPLMGLLTKAVPVVSLISGGSTPGINRTTFQFSLTEKLFGLGDILSTHSRILIRVQNDPIQDGTTWIYTAQIVKPDPDLFVDPTDFESGKEVSKEFSAFEEYSEGGTDYDTTPFWFENQLTTMRKQFSMTGGAQTDVMILSTSGGGNKPGSQLWMYEKEYQFMLKWQEECERMLWYSEYNKDPKGQVHLPGANGRPVMTGAGILEQISPTNKRYYGAELSEQTIREFLTDLMENARDAEQTKFVGFCGYWFFDAFDQAMKKSIQRYTIVDSKFITGSGQELTLGGQFVTYKGLNGTELTLIHNPLYDNPVNNRKLHPITKKPLESYRCTILDFGMYGGESNISMLAKGADGIDRSFLSWYTAGSQTPGGAMGADNVKGYMNTMRSNSLDGWTVNFLAEKGVKVTNPLSCGELICNADEVL